GSAPCEVEMRAELDEPEQGHQEHQVARLTSRPRRKMPLGHGGHIRHGAILHAGIGPATFARRGRIEYALLSMRSFIVGGAGFIGSHLTDKLVEHGPVTIYDNLSVGKRQFVDQHLSSGAATLVNKDALDLEALTQAMAGHDVVVHLAANPEARWGLERTRLDLEQGTIATYDVLEAMRRAAVPRVVFASSGTVYGET